MIQSLKYRDRQEGVRLFGRWLTRAGRELLADADLLLPVPRYRVAALLKTVQSIGAACPRGERNLLHPQAEAADGEPSRAHGRAAAALARSWSRRPARSRVRGENIVVIDDVITTGATVEACARVLKRSKAARVDVLAFARAVEPAAFLL
ncbi:MAG: ComF family protein [Methyloceanibacter sp.]